MGAGIMPVGGDVNAPAMVVTPKWGPDQSSLRMAFKAFFFGSSASPANIGIGPRPAPDGASFTEGSKTDTWLPAQQQFTGVTKAIVDPAIATLRKVAQFPSAGVATDPLLGWDVDTDVML